MGGSSSILQSSPGSGYEALDVIRFIDFETFKKHGTFPRNPENQTLTITLRELLPQYEDSLIVFISHNWLRGWPGAVGFDGRPHPDDSKGGKFELCVDGIEQIKTNLAKGMKKCYLWLDYACIDQNNGAAAAGYIIKWLQSIVKISDCLFTPIVDDQHNCWVFPTSYSNIYEAYQSQNWKEGPYAYLNRGWCRTEMFYAANVPLIRNENDALSLLVGPNETAPKSTAADPAVATDNSNVTDQPITTQVVDDLFKRRLQKMSAGLAYHRGDGRRPHILYGSKDQAMMQMPRILPPLQNSWFERYNPTKGNVTNPADMTLITGFVEELTPLMTFVKAGYHGQKKKGKKNGKGQYLYSDGSSYDGEWKNDKMHGHGVFRFSSGNRYEGSWKEDKEEGHGVYYYADGDVYDGAWKAGKKNGKGCYRYASGNVYDGDWVNGCVHGKGTFIYAASGDRYEGDWVEDVKEGKGVYYYGDGSGMKYEGEYKNGQKHGRGVQTNRDGSKTEGIWEHGEKVA